MARFASSADFVCYTQLTCSSVQSYSMLSSPAATAQYSFSCCESSLTLWLFVLFAKPVVFFVISLPLHLADLEQFVNIVECNVTFLTIVYKLV